MIRFDEIQIPPQPGGSVHPLLDLRVITTRGEAVLEKAVEVLPADQKRQTNPAAPVP